MKNCDFSSNKGAKSVIYVKQYRQTLFEVSKSITYLINSSFCDNEGVAIYLSSRHHILHILEKYYFRTIQHKKVQEFISVITLLSFLVKTQVHDLLTTLFITMVQQYF